MRNYNLIYFNISVQYPQLSHPSFKKRKTSKAWRHNRKIIVASKQKWASAFEKKNCLKCFYVIKEIRFWLLTWKYKITLYYHYWSDCNCAGILIKEFQVSHTPKNHTQQLHYPYSKIRQQFPYLVVKILGILMWAMAFISVVFMLLYG